MSLFKVMRMYIMHRIIQIQKPYELFKLAAGEEYRIKIYLLHPLLNCACLQQPPASTSQA